MTDSATPPTPIDPDQVPKHTTPTWEVELLISGVAVFAMLQLPGWLDDRYFALLPRFDQDWVGLIQSLYIYLRSAAVLLALTFLLHLTLRAHWIALVGMHSVFPDGVRWERMRMGPAQREASEPRLGAATDAIERADNRATVVFAMGVMLGTLLVIVSMVVGVISGAAQLLQYLFPANHNLPLTFLVLFMLVMLPYSAAKLYDHRESTLSWSQRAIVRICTMARLPRLATRMQDRWAAKRRPEPAWKRPLLIRIFNAYARVGMGRNSYAWTLFSSHVGERRTILIVWLIFFPILIIGGLNVLAVKSPDLIGNYGLFPHIVNSSRAMNAAYYDDQRDVARSKANPYIQSAVVTEPYVKLVVPYQPSRDTGALKRLCTKNLRRHNAQARAESALDCLGTLHAVTLDGKPLKDLRYDAGSDTRNQRPALVAMIDVRDLTPGRHELSVMRAPDDPVHNDKDDKLTRYVIPFWR